MFQDPPDSRGGGDIEIGDNADMRHNSCIITGVASGSVIVGRNFLLAEHSIIEARGGGSPHATSGVYIGDNVEIMMCCVIGANGKTQKIKIGNNCKIAHMVSIKTTHHHINPNAVCIGAEAEFDGIEIHDGCWICAGAMILPGVSIGKKNVIAAGAVVTKDTEEFVLMAGVPAIEKKHYYEEKS